MKRILVLGCGGSAGINYIKALRIAPEQFYIVGVDVNKYYIEMSPVDKRYLVQHSRGKEKGYLKVINKIIKNEKIEFVHAQPDPEVKIISDYRNQINARTFLPSKNAVDISHDKWATYQTLLQAKIPVAKTIRVKDEGSLKEIFKNIPGDVWLRANTGAGGKASLPVKSIQQASMWITYWLDKGLKWSDFLSSETLTGTEISWLSVWKEGKLVCSQGKERVEWVGTGASPSGVTGTTAIQRTVSSQQVNDIATKTVQAVDKNPNGIYVVDTKENSSGVPCVMEINPGRFFTTSLFFASAGVNMPYIFTQLAFGEKTARVRPYNSVRENIYWMRIPDGGPIMIENNGWTAIKI